MKFTFLSIALIAVLSCAAGVCGFWIRYNSDAGGGPDDSLLWLRQEFSLSPGQLERIERLHEAYQTVCEEHCRIIREARAEVRRLKEEGVSPEPLRTAEHHAAEVDARCRASLEAHLREVASIMGEPEGARYLSLVLPRVSHFDHHGAPSLEIKGPATSHAH